MTAEVVAAPLTVREAERAVEEAFVGIWPCKRNWERLRARLDVPATTRARTELSLAILGLVNASAVLAEAEDRIGPAWAATRTRLGRLFARVSAGQKQSAQAWRDYQEARRGGDRVGVDAARQVWHNELLAWHVQLHERWAVADQEDAERLSRRLDDSTRLHPDDAFPASRSRRTAVVSESRERERQESIRRADAGLSNPWVRASRGRGSRPGS